MSVCAYIYRNNNGQITRVVLTNREEEDMGAEARPEESLSGWYEIEDANDCKRLLDLVSPVRVDVM